MSTPTSGFYLDQILFHFPELAGLRSEPVRLIQQGWGSLVLESGREDSPGLIFRFPRLKSIQEGYVREARLLSGLAPHLPLSIPQFTCIAPDFSFVGYRKIMGEQIDDSLLDFPGAVRQLADFLNALHGFPIEQVPALGLPLQSPAEWRQFYVDFYTWARAEALPLLDNETRKKAAQAWEIYLEDERCFTFQPVLIHRDLSSEHILWNPQTGKINGVIDWEDAAMGDPAMDFVGLWFIQKGALVEALLKNYQHPLGEAFEKRMTFYRSVIPYHTIRYGIDSGQPSFFENGLRGLIEALK